MRELLAIVLAIGITFAVIRLVERYLAEID